MADTDELIEGVLRDGHWHQEQHLVEHLVSQLGMASDAAFRYVIQFWHRETGRIERRYDSDVMDFQWRLAA